MTRDNTKWIQWRRYSSRENRPLKRVKIADRATYEGEFIPLYIHVGHRAIFGLAKNRVNE